MGEVYAWYKYLYDSNSNRNMQDTHFDFDNIKNNNNTNNRKMSFVFVGLVYEWYIVFHLDYDIKTVMNHNNTIDVEENKQDVDGYDILDVLGKR